MKYATYVVCVCGMPYLEKRRRRWYAKIETPKDLLAHYGGKRRFVKSLKTESLSEAERRVLPVIARFKAEFAAVRTGSTEPLLELAESWHVDLTNAQGDQLETLQGLLEDKAEEIALNDPQAATLFFETVTGKSVPLLKQVEAWSASLDCEPKTRDMQLSDVREFIKGFPNSRDVSRASVQQWVDELQVGPSTINRKLSAYRSFWRYLERNGLVDRERAPFVGLVVEARSKTKRAKVKKRQPFSVENVVALLNAADATGDKSLADLIWLGMWTGCRIEELCSLRISDVNEHSFHVVDAKTPAGFRSVPIHSRLAPYLQALCLHSEDGYVLSGLTSNKYDDRSNAIGKRFGRLKKKNGFDGSFVFHSVRKTVTTLLENAGVPENVAADIVGHEKQTITYGLYSGGSSLIVMREAIEKITYPLVSYPLRFDSS